MRKLLFFFFALLASVSGAWAQPITVTLVDGKNAPYDTYGTRNNSATPNTFTSKDASGLAGVVLSAPVIDRATWWSTYCLALCPSATQTAETVTFTAPEGYLLLSVNMTAQANSSDYPYDVVFNGSTTNVTGASAKTFSANNILAPSFSFTINHTTASFHAKNKWLALKSLTLQLVKIVTNTSQINANKSYVVKCDRSAWAVANNGTSLSTIGTLNLALSIPDAKQRFAFVTRNGTDYYLYSVNAGKFLHAENNAGDGGSWVYGPSADKVYFADASSYKANTWRVYLEGTNKNINVGGSNQVTINSYATADAGCAYYLIEAADVDGAQLAERLKGPISVTWNVISEANGTPIVTGTSDAYRTESLALPSNLSAFCCTYEYFSDAACTSPITSFASDYASTTGTVYAKYTWNGPVKYTTTTAAPEYYNLNIRSQYLVYDDAATGDVKLQSTSEPFNNDASWAFIGDPYTGFKLINKTKGTDQYLTYTSVVPGGNGGNNNIGFVAEGDFTDQYWCIDTNTSGFVLRMKNNNNIYFHHDNTKQFLRTCSKTEWSAVHNDQGSTIVASTDEDVLFALYDELKTWSFGTNVGQMNTTDAGTVSNEEAAGTITSVGSAIASATTSAYPNCYTSLLTVKNNTALVEPTAGFYRLKNVATGKYLTATATGGWNSASKGIYANGNNTDASTVIRLFDKDENSTLYMYCQGYGFGWTDASKNSGSGGVAWITGSPDKYLHWFPGKAANQIAFAICYGNGTGSFAAYLKQGIYTADTDDESVVAGADYTDNKAQWLVEPATSATVTLNSDGAATPTYYATFCAPFSYTVSDAIAYTMKENGDYLVPTAVEGEVAAGTPVLLKGTSATATLTIRTDYAASPATGTALTGTYLAATIDGANDYVLGIDDGGVVGFYHWDSNNLAANRAYVDTPASVNAYNIDWSGETGINAIGNVQSTDKAIYNLAGQRVQKAQKGLYIVNGKKMLVK